ncbi:protein grpE [Candidatus Vecturithrix granuli]|uniref:Protein GrpE n=1 Tax=Vecturithrix granuli TaxID=1499967 RepID=A0A081BV70_VECG1|nr:protein grpE [Candidatus Vecturithrix granuli]
MTNPSSAQPTYADVLTINGGSSSIKFALYHTSEALEQRFRGSKEKIAHGSRGAVAEVNRSPCSLKTRCHMKTFARENEQNWLPPTDPAGELESVRAELRDERDRYMRLLADFQNYRRRIEREGEKFAAEGKREVIVPLLSVLDDLERALQWASDGEQPLVQSMRLIYKKLLALLETQDVRPFDSVGKQFTPDLHEAVAVVDDEDVESGTIVDDLRRGYLWKNELLRPTQVRVAT